MKASYDNEGNLVVEVGKGERDLLLKMLALYPVVPSGYARLSKDKNLKDLAANQELLEESLSEQRTENRQFLQGLFRRCMPRGETKTALRLKLSPPDYERLLQVLNDVRIGSWLALGAPEEKPSTLDPQTAPHVWAMEIAGFFQTSLLGTLDND